VDRIPYQLTLSRKRGGSGIVREDREKGSMLWREGEDCGDKGGVGERVIKRGGEGGGETKAQMLK